MLYDNIQLDFAFIVKSLIRRSEVMWESDPPSHEANIIHSTAGRSTLHQQQEKLSEGDTASGGL